METIAIREDDNPTIKNLLQRNLFLLFVCYVTSFSFAISDTTSNALEGEEKHRAEVLKNADEERRPLSVKKTPYFFRVTEDSSESKKKVLVAFIPSKKRSLMAFIEKIVLEILEALPHPLSSKILNSSNPNGINTRDTPILSSDEGEVHEIFNMMGCKKETVVKDDASSSSSSSLESWTVCTSVRLLPTLCMSALVTVLFPKWMWNWRFPLAFCLASFLFTLATDSLIESCPTLPSSRDFIYVLKVGLSLLAAAGMIIMRPCLQHEMQEIQRKELVVIEEREEDQEEEKADESSNVASLKTIIMRPRLQHKMQEIERKEPVVIEEQEEDLEEETDGESSNVASLRTNSHQQPRTHELAKNPGNIPTSINLITSKPAKRNTHQDNEVPSIHVQNHLDEVLIGHQRPFYQFNRYTFTSQRNCLRFFWLFVLITTLVIIITICYKPRRNFITSTSKLELIASEETQEFTLDRRESRVLIPTMNDTQKEGNDKELGTSGSIKHTGSLRESTVINSSSTTNVKLRIVVPIKKGFHEFIRIYNYPENNHTLVTGFVVDVFNEAMKTLPNQVLWEFIPYESSYKDATGYYDKLASQINLKTQGKSYDAVVGDVTETVKRSNYGDFSRFLSSGVSMIVPIDDDNDVNHLWWFFKPFSAEMWIVIFVFFFLKGVLLWLLEHQTNQGFQLGTIMSFCISTSAQRVNFERGSSKFIVDVWTISLFIIGAAYSANLSMLLSNGTPQVTNTDLETLIENGDNVGYQNGSFVFELLKQRGFHESKLKAYSTEKEYADALSLGSAKNGVSAIIDEIPYIRVFLTRYGHRYAMGGLIRIITGSFGFVFPKGSEMSRNISQAILQMQEVGRITELKEKWFESLSCSGGSIQAPGSFKKLGFHQFRGLFLIMGLATCATFLLPLLIWCDQHKRDVIVPQWEKIKAWFYTHLVFLANMVWPS